MWKDNGPTRRSGKFDDVFRREIEQPQRALRRAATMLHSYLCKTIGPGVRSINGNRGVKRVQVVVSAERQLRTEAL